MKIVIPMAGRGIRTNDYSNLPKPLADINGKTMIEWVIKSLDIKGDYIFITRRYEHYGWNEKLNSILKGISKNCEIIEIDYVTTGPAASALLAEQFIDNNEELIISNCDQIMEWDSNDFLKSCRNPNIDGLVITQNMQNPKNSYIQLNDQGYGERLAEKELISDHALTGVHYWKRGKDFVSSAKQMIEKDIKFNNEYYISLSYNFLIEAKQKIGIYEIGLNQNWATGTTEDILNFIKSHENI